MDINIKKKNVAEGKKIKSNACVIAEQVQSKQAENPQYIPTKAEFSAMKKWAKEQEQQRKREIQAGKKQVSKKNNQMKKRRRAKTVVPRTVQQSIPYIADYAEGMFEVGLNKYSKLYRVRDINYRDAHEDAQVGIFCKYGEFLNYFSEDMHVVVCIDNRVVSKNELERKVLYQKAGDGYDGHREEYNNIMRRQIVAGKNDIQVEKYVSVTIDADTPIEALLRFHKIDANVLRNLKRIGSDGEVMTTEERLEIYHDKFRKGREGELKTDGKFNIDFKFLKQAGISSKDYIAPASFIFERDHLRIEDEYYCCLFLNNMPASLTDDFLGELADNDFPITTSIGIQPVAQDKGLKIVKRQLTGMEANRIEAEKKAMRAGYSPEVINHDLKNSLVQAEELLDDMTNKNQKMFFVSLTCMVSGSSKDELEENVRSLESKARKYTCQLQRFRYQQEEAMKATLPFGYVSKNLRVARTLTTESTSIFMPFSNQELFQPGGIYYGLNQISHNLILCNRSLMQTPSGFVLGSSGSGKSFATKREVLNVLLNDGRTSVLIIDPENEYSDFARAFGGEVIKISADSDIHINPMEMPEDYGLDEDDDSEKTPMSTKKDKAIRKKSEYIMGIVEKMLGTEDSINRSTLEPAQKTIIDRCVKQCFQEYLDHDFDQKYLPTLMNLQEEFDKERGNSEEARKIAEGVEYYTKGSMDVFSHKTNIKMDNRFVVFNIRDLGNQLRPIALNIVFDFIWSRMVQNKSKGIATSCYCDEIHIMFDSYHSAHFLQQLYKRGRKYGLCITGITQNVQELLRSEMARSMIANSKFIMMLNQSHEDLMILADMLKISEVQQGYVEMANQGHGLLFAENTIVPFQDEFPKDSYLYTLMSTKFGEKSKEEVDQMIEEILKKGQESIDELQSA